MDSETALKIDSIPWSEYETAYGNAAEEGEFKNVPENLRRLFSGDKEAAMQATHHLWCGLCHQHAYVSSAALPAYGFLLHGLNVLDDDLKVELLDILLGFARCTAGMSADESWQGQLKAGLMEYKAYFRTLTSHENEDIAAFSAELCEEIE